MLQINRDVDINSPFQHAAKRLLITTYNCSNQMKMGSQANFPTIYFCHLCNLSSCLSTDQTEINENITKQKNRKQEGDTCWATLWPRDRMISFSSSCEQPWQHAMRTRSSSITSFCGSLSTEIDAFRKACRSPLRIAATRGSRSCSFSSSQI